MPQLISADDLKDRFDISPDIKQSRLDPNIGSASRRLRKWVGEDVYAQALGTDAQYDDLRSDLKNAEAHLAYHFAVFGLNSPMSTKGMVVTSQSDKGGEMRKYLAPKETAELAQYFLDMAQEIAGPYMLAVDSTIVFEVVGDEDAEASTREWNGSRSCC
jgi:hypothetical protein